MDHERARRRGVRAYETRIANGERLPRRSIDAPEGHKWCARCQGYRPRTSFGGIDKLQAYCRPCTKIYASERRLMIIFGLTWEEYDFLLMCQDGGCAICHGKPRKHMLAVDHDHKTGEIRGLLCSRCNHRLLGAANDSAPRLRAAADYLEAFAPRDVFGEPKIVPSFRAGAA